MHCVYCSSGKRYRICSGMGVNLSMNQMVNIPRTSILNTKTVSVLVSFIVDRNVSNVFATQKDFVKQLHPASELTSGHHK